MFQPTVAAKRSTASALVALSMACMFGVTPVYARGGSGISVTTTINVTGTVVSGTITITNTGSRPATITSVTDSLEVRFPSGYVPPPLPAGVTSGYYRVVTITLPPPSPVPALGTATIAYSIDTCNPQVANFRGAKDIRNGAVVTSGTAVQARSPNVPAPLQSTCPVCGNAVREGTEQCDGGGCCTTACVFAANGTGCNDVDACTQTDQCQNGACLGGNPVICISSDQCHSPGTCSPTTGTCSNPSRPNGTACSDGSECTLGDACSTGRCAGSPMVCNDADACTSDSCTGGVCVYVNDTSACEDGSVCTDGDTCTNGACMSGPPLPCEDHKACTEDLCAEEVGCTHTPTPTCEGCYADECGLCRIDCTVAQALCSENCWLGFSSCLAGCTTTYCAPFCQVDLGACLGACPGEAACFGECDAGNGCAADCSL